MTTYISSSAFVYYNVLIGENTFIFENNTMQYYASNNVGRVGYANINPDNTREIFDVSLTAVLYIGRIGCFDDNGIVPISAVRANKQIYGYYIGFQLDTKVS